MLILDQQNLDLKRLINIQKCHSSSKFDHCAVGGTIALLHPLLLRPCNRRSGACPNIVCGNLEGKQNLVI